MTRLAPIDPQIDVLAEDAHREALRSLLTQAGGNVSTVARDLAAVAGEPVQNVRRRLDRRITALGLRPWLEEHYPGPGRVKPATQTAK